MTTTPDPIVIIDYGMGNLRSVQKAIERVGATAVIRDDVASIESASRLILPGVGAFADAMTALNTSGLADPIRQYCQDSRPFLGICLGLQLLFDESDEGGRHEGLGIIPGRVVQFDDRPGRKVPHMGWNTVQRCSDHPLFQSVQPESHFYFVHSHYVVPEDDSYNALMCDYEQSFTAAIGYKNIAATQFHPEKSQSVGLELLSHFVAAPSASVSSTG